MKQNQPCQLSECTQCGSSVSSSADKCPHCDTAWFRKVFSCYCCGEPVTKKEATKVLCEGSNHDKLGDFSYGAQIGDENQKNQVRCTYSEFMPDGEKKVCGHYDRRHTDNSELLRLIDHSRSHNEKSHDEQVSDLAISMRAKTKFHEDVGFRYYRLYHADCHSQISAHEKTRHERYQHEFHCSLCGNQFRFADNSNKVSITCNKCGHPDNTNKVPKRDYRTQCIHCEFVIDTSAQDSMLINYFNQEVLIHSMCNPTHLREQKEALFVRRQNLVEQDKAEAMKLQKEVAGQQKEKAERKAKAELEALKREDEKDKKMQARKDAETLASAIRLIPVGFAAFVGIVAAFEMPHPVFAVIRGLFYGAMAWALAAIVCYPLASMIEGNK